MTSSGLIELKRIILHNLEKNPKFCKLIKYEFSEIHHLVRLLVRQYSQWVESMVKMRDKWPLRIVATFIAS
jgi:hypothetical protein